MCSAAVFINFKHLPYVPCQHKNIMNINNTLQQQQSNWNISGISIVGFVPKRYLWNHFHTLFLANSSYPPFFYYENRKTHHSSTQKKTITLFCLQMSCNISINGSMFCSGECDAWLQHQLHSCSLHMFMNENQITSFVFTCYSHFPSFLSLFLFPSEPFMPWHIGKKKRESPMQS